MSQPEEVGRGRKFLVKLAFYGAVFFAPSLFFLDYDALFTSDDARNRVIPLGRAGTIEVIAIGDEAHRRCRMILLPRGTGPHGNKRTFLAIEHAPLAKAADQRIQVLFIPGSPPDQTQRSILTVDGIEFPFFARGNTMSARDMAAVYAIVAALQRGREATVRGRLENGTDLSLSLGLQGMMEAMGMMVAECGTFMPRTMPEPTHGAPTPPLALGTFGDFQAFTRDTDIGKTCYLTVASRGVDKGSSRGRLIVTNDPVRGLYGEIQILPGETMAAGTRLALSFSLQAKTFRYDILAEGDHAWALPHVEEGMTRALQAGNSLRLTVPRAEGPSLDQSYSATGYVEARKAIDKACS